MCTYVAVLNLLFAPGRELPSANIALSDGPTPAVCLPSSSAERCMLVDSSGPHGMVTGNALRLCCHILGKGSNAVKQFRRQSKASRPLIVEMRSVRSLKAAEATRGHPVVRSGIRGCVARTKTQSTWPRHRQPIISSGSTRTLDVQAIHDSSWTTSPWLHAKLLD